MGAAELSAFCEGEKATFLLVVDFTKLCLLHRAGRPPSALQADPIYKYMNCFIFVKIFDCKVRNLYVRLVNYKVDTEF